MLVTRSNLLRLLVTSLQRLLVADLLRLVASLLLLLIVGLLLLLLGIDLLVGLCRTCLLVLGFARLVC